MSDNQLLERYETLKDNKKKFEDQLTAVRSRKQTLEERSQSLGQSLKTKYGIENLESLRKAINQLENELEKRVSAVEEAIKVSGGNNGVA